MTRHAQVTFALDADLNEAFVAAAEADNRSASDILREFMGDYVRSYEEAEGYKAFLQNKVAAVRNSLEAGRGQSNAEVEAEFAAKRAAIASSHG